MKKFTALLLVVLMVVSFIPFGAFAATEWTEVKTAEDFAKMTDGKYWLTADIDLSKVAWTTIAEFKGTLNGNGKTVTVPADALIIEKLSGTVKNLNLKGAMTLDAADASTYIPQRDVKGGGIGALAAYAQGATIDNVNVNVNINYSGTIANVGGIVGNAYPVFEGTDKATYVRSGANTITNCTVAGEWTVKFAEPYKNAIGGVAGLVTDSTVIDSCVVTVKATVENSKGQCGGIAGSSFTDVIINDFNETMVPPAVQNSLFAGDFTFNTTGANLDQTAALVGYCRGGTIKNCAATGAWAVSGGGSRHFVSYSNIGDADYSRVMVTGNVSTATVTNNGNVVNELAYSKNAGAFFVGNYVLAGQTFNTSGLNNAANQVKENVDVADAGAAYAAFAAANEKFEVKDGAIVLELPTFTPEADPFTPPTPVFKDGATLEVTGDIKLTAYDQQALRGEAKAEYVNTNGVDNSASIKVTRTFGGAANQAGHLELHMDIASAGKLGENKYLVVWVDFTNVEMRKACFGLSDENGNIYRTDDDDGTYPEFYYLADGAAEWETLKHGKDGCFGVGDDGSQSVKGKKGYFAFPVEDFQKGKTAISADTVVDGVYFFLTYPEDKVNTVVAEPFYLDDFQLVEDYTTITEPDEPDTPAPTGDMTIVLGAVALVSLAAVTVIAKKKVNE